MNGSAGQMSSAICERELRSMTNLTVTNGADGFLTGYNITDSIMLSTTQAVHYTYLPRILSCTMHIAPRRAPFPFSIPTVLTALAQVSHRRASLSLTLTLTPQPQP